MKVRKVKQKDLDELVELCGLHAAYESVEYSSSGKRQKLEAALFSETPKLYCWVVDSGDKIFGYVSATKEFSTWNADYYIHMDCLYLREGTRGQGIGPKLMETLEDFAKQQNCKLIQWQTPLENELGIKFYDKLDTTWKLKRRYYLDL